MKRVKGDSYVLDFEDHQEEVNIPVGNTLTIGPVSGETWTMDRMQGSFLVMDSTLNVHMKLLPRNKKEIQTNGNKTGNVL